jgi:RNA polymerase sigma-70 factor, ECF subfamily
MPAVERSWVPRGATGLVADPRELTTPPSDGLRDRGERAMCALGSRVDGASATSGHQPTWDEIAERYGHTVFTMAYRLTGDTDEARDLAQDVFVRVYRNLDRYQPGTFEGWLYRITRNLFLDRVRRRSRVRLETLPLEDWRQPPEPGPDPAERVDAGMLGGALEQALHDLPPSFRTAVVLCDLQGLTYEEISAATGWPIGTVRSRIHRGRKLLRGHLGVRRIGG